MFFPTDQDEPLNYERQTADTDLGLLQLVAIIFTISENQMCDSRFRRRETHGDAEHHCQITNSTSTDVPLEPSLLSLLKHSGLALG
jgi:hypothetical protein